MGMTKDQKDKFEILNNGWTLIKPYVPDKEKEYKTILSAYFKILFKDYMAKDQDEWMDAICKELMDYPERLRDKPDLCEFATELTIAIGKYLSRKKYTNYEFYKFVGEVFIAEWERLNEKEVKAQTAG